MLARLRDLFRYGPTRRYAALVLLTAPVWLLATTSIGNSVIAIVLITLIFLPIYDAFQIPAKDSISVIRHFQPMIGLGDPESGEYEIQSQRRQNLAVQLSHQFPTALESAIPNPKFRLSAEFPSRVAFSATGRTRGSFSLGKVSLVINGPLGLTEKRIIYNLNDTISIIPSVAENRRYRLLSIQRQMRMAGQRAIRLRGQGAAFSNLREYVIGDDPRHIDWKASARRAHLISREYTIEQGQTVLIVIDAGRMMTQYAGNRTRFEYALSSALTLADVALATGDQVGLLVFNEELRSYVPPARGATALNHIREALSGVTVTLSEPDYAAAFKTIAERHKRRSLIVLFTDVIDARSSRAIVANTARTALKHLPIVIALRNEQLTEAAIPSRQENVGDVYRSVAAEELLSAREEVLQDMRMAGVQVIDTPPHSMTALIINRYLDIKDRGLL